MSTLKIAAVFADKAEAEKVAKLSQSLMFEASADKTEHLPFAALVLGTSAALMDLKQRTDVGLYLVSERAVLNQPLSVLNQDMLPASVGIFPMVANAEIGAEAADKHWREKHAPIALEVHTAMTHYYQLAVMHRFSGANWNGLPSAALLTKMTLGINSTILLRVSDSGRGCCQICGYQKLSETGDSSTHRPSSSVIRDEMMLLVHRSKLRKHLKPILRGQQCLQLNHPMVPSP